MADNFKLAYVPEFSSEQLEALAVDGFSLDVVDNEDVVDWDAVNVVMETESGEGGASVDAAILIRSLARLLLAAQK